MNGIRKFYREHGVKEIQRNVFVAEGENAAVALYMPVMNLMDSNHEFIFLLDKCTYDLGYEVDDVIAVTIEWYDRENVDYSMYLEE